MKLTDDSPMPFGKHKGAPMQDVPAAYLDYLHGSIDHQRNHGPGRPSQDALAVLGYCERNRDVLDKELEREGSQ